MRGRFQPGQPEIFNGKQRDFAALSLDIPVLSDRPL
jgi:hypothetical protein